MMSLRQASMNAIVLKVVLPVVTVGWVSGCTGPATSADAACAPLVEGVPVRVAEHDGATLALVELWRTGGLDRELATPVSLNASASGMLAVPDFELSELILIAADGEWLGPWGRRGEGPGELLMPVAATWDGDTVAVFDIGRARIVYLFDGQSTGREEAVDPALITKVIAAGELEWAAVLAGGDALVHDAFETPGPDGMAAQIIVRAGPSTDGIDTVAAGRVPAVTEGHHRGRPAPGAPRALVAVGGGRIAIGAMDGTYRVLVTEADGTPLHQVCGTATALPVTAAERGEGVQGPLADELRPAYAAAPEADEPAPFGRLIVGARGGLLVQRDRPKPFVPHDALYGAAGATHDLYDPAGRHIGVIEAPAGHRVQAMSGDRVYGLAFGEFDEPWIVAWRLRPESSGTPTRIDR
jgi:hypothetical protein